LCASGVFAAEDIAGQWEFKSEFGGRQMTANVTFTKNADGTYSGKWATQRGESDLSDVKFADGKLTFVRTTRRQDQETKMTYTGTLADGKITGAATGGRGDFPFEATRAGAAAPAAAPAAKPAGVDAVLGQWDMKVTMPQRETTAKMTISKKADGALEGKWEAQMGESTMSDVKFDAGKLTFTRKSKFQDREFESKFEGTIEGDQLKGMFKSDRGEMAAVGTKVKPAAPAAAPAPAAGVVGKWELTTTGQQGARTRILTINADMTGTYQMRENEIPVKDLKLDGNKLTFKIEGSGERQFQMEFKGEIDGANLKGEFITERGAREVTGKKVN